MTIILNNQQSSVGSPYVFYTVSYEEIANSRTIDSVQLKIQVDAYLQYSQSYLGTGYPLTAYITINGVEYPIVLKERNDVWTGTTLHTAISVLTISNISSTTTSLNNILYRVYSVNNDSGYLPNVSCSNITITTGHIPPSDIQYTITELNQKLIDAEIDNDVFVKDLSIKQFDISATLYDDADYDYTRVFNYIYPMTSTSENKQRVIWNFENYALRFGDSIEEPNKIPIKVMVVDNQGGSTTTNNPNNAYGFTLYDGIKYNSITINEDKTTVKRLGQISGRVRLDIEGEYFNGVIGNKDQSNTYKPTIKYKYWKYGDTEPSTYANTISAANITVNNGKFNVSNLDIGSATETDPNYFDPDYAYRIKIKVEDYFTDKESNEKNIYIGEAVWTEYKDHVDFKKITLKGNELDGVKRTLLWENQNPTNSFSAQNIYLSSSDYDELIWYFKETGTSTNLFSSTILKGYGTRLSFSFAPSDVKGAIYSRTITRNSDTSFGADSAYYYYHTGSQNGVNNNLCVPIYVYGIKYVK